MTKHRHSWSFSEWVNAPWREDDPDHYWTFSLKEHCDCGKERKREAVPQEVRDHLNSLKCSYCSMLNVKHESQADCFKHLFDRVKKLEDKLSKLASVLE